MELSFRNAEFEREVRKQLNIFDRAITVEDAQRVTELELIDFDIQDEDAATLTHFHGLKELALEMKNQGAAFWSNFPKLEELYWVCWLGAIDFSVFASMPELRSLFVSGGDYSDISFENLEALLPLQKLSDLSLHEFGPVDLAPLKTMKQLRSLFVGYSTQVRNISAIGAMTQLKSLSLNGLDVENLDFLDTLPDNVELEMCGIRILGTTSVDVSKWKRFLKRDICEIGIKDLYWDYVDLSSLDEKPS